MTISAMFTTLNPLKGYTRVNLQEAYETFQRKILDGEARLPDDFKPTGRYSNMAVIDLEDIVLRAQVIRVRNDILAAKEIRERLDRGQKTILIGPNENIRSKMINPFIKSGSIHFHGMKADRAIAMTMYIPPRQRGFIPSML